MDFTKVAESALLPEPNKAAWNSAEHPLIGRSGRWLLGSRLVSAEQDDLYVTACMALPVVGGLCHLPEADRLQPRGPL